MNKIYLSSTINTTSLHGMAAKLRHIRKRLSQFLNCFEFSATAADLGKLLHSSAITDRQIDLDRQTDRSRQTG